MGWVIFLCPNAEAVRCLTNSIRTSVKQSWRRYFIIYSRNGHWQCTQAGRLGKRQHGLAALFFVKKTYEMAVFHNSNQAVAPGLRSGRRG